MITAKVIASNVKASNTGTNLESVLLFILDVLSVLLLLSLLVCIMATEDEEEYEEELLTVGLNL